MSKNLLIVELFGGLLTGRTRYYRIVKAHGNKQDITEFGRDAGSIPAPRLTRTNAI